MNEIELRKLHAAVSKEYDIGDYNEFKSKMGTKEDRKKFFDAMLVENFDLGDNIILVMNQNMPVL